LAVVVGMLFTPALGNIIWLIAEGFIDKGGCFSYVEHYFISLGIIVCVWLLNFRTDVGDWMVNIVCNTKPCILCL
jgi:hypothetical protein